MNPLYPNSTAAAMASNIDDEPQEQRQPGSFLYQAATILAILLFLISF